MPRHLYLDIETLPALDMTFDEMQELVAPPKKPVMKRPPSNWKDPAKIAAFEANAEEEWERALLEWDIEYNELVEAAWERTSLDPLLCVVCCIGYRFDGGEEHALLLDHDVDSLEDARHAEAALLGQFENVLAEHTRGESFVLVGHNVATFDLPIVKLRAWKYRLRSLALALPYSKRDTFDNGRIVDTMHRAIGPGRGYLKLQGLTRFFGIEAPEEQHDQGSEVYRLWMDGRHEEVARHCKKDIRRVAAVHGRMRP